MKSRWMLLGVVLNLGCLEPNPDVLPRPTDMTALPDLVLPRDLATPPDLLPCPTYAPGGGGGKNRPEVYLAGGKGPVGGSGAFDVKPFFLDVFEVTVGAYRECVNDNMKCSAPCTWTSSPMGKELNPVNCITWKQANDFCAWAGRRLPTEVEWEFAAGGPAGAASKYPWGNDEPTSEAGKAQLCWSGTSGGGTCPVGQYPRTITGVVNCGGVADIAGGVWEWTNTEYASTYMQPEKPCDSMRSSLCSLRGGSWGDSSTGAFQAAYRLNGAPMGTSGVVGVRCARTP